MGNKFLVLKPNGPFQMANESLKIRQGQVTRHPGYPVDPAVLEEFDDAKKAQAAAERNAEAFNQIQEDRRRGVIQQGREAAAAAREPSVADRTKALSRAKRLEKAGSSLALVDPNEKRIAELEAELANLKSKREVDSEAYLDQKADVVAKRVRTAAKKGRLKKEDIEQLIEAEKSGKSRHNVLETLKNYVRDDAIFGKLFKK